MSMQDKKQQVMDSIRQIAESALTGSKTKVIVAANDHVDYDELYEFECRVDRLSQND